MPVDPNNIYADKAHDKTIQVAGWTYGCHSDKTGPGPRGEASKIEVQEGWTDDGRRVMRLTDPQCTGCVNRRDE